jgi:hypothetical protein
MESGRDGVGDYTRLLAQECARQGHTCCIVALNDRHISETVTLQVEPIELRLPATMAWPQRVAVAKSFLDDFKPDWVSLQFVPYGYDDKGLVFGLAKRLGSLRTGRRFEIMFHETWIGELADAPWKHRVVGELQRRLVIGMTRQLKPDVIHTSNSTYACFLQRDGVKASILPLFGNIPVCSRQRVEWLYTEMNDSGIAIAEENRQDYLLAGFFGTLQTDWPAEPLLPTLRDIARERGKRLAILSMGAPGSGQALWERLVKRYAPEIGFHRFGRRSPEEISQYLLSLDYGISTTDRARVGKSGSVAAMLDHGLPVIVNQESETFPRIAITSMTEDPLLHSMAQFQDAARTGIRRGPALQRLPEIAARFVKDLSEVEADNLCLA